MSVTNPWLTPYQRSYQQIKSKILEELKNLKDSKGINLITDYSEGNIFITIISIFAAVAEVIHYYIDNMARETFFSTARRYDSLVKHGELVDYHAHGAVASTVDITISRPILSDKIGAQISIPKDTQFTDNSGNTWVSTKDITWYANTTEVSVPIIQHVFYSDANMIGTIIGNYDQNNAIIEVPSLGNGQYYEHGTMSLVIGTTTWTLVDTFAFSGKYDTHFMVTVDANGRVYIKFGDGTKGMIPDPGYKITSCTYYITAGAKGNVKEGAITNVPSSIKSTVNDATCANIFSAGGGSNYETFSMLKEHIPLHVRTLGVAITKQDFIDLAMQVPGVNKCALEYECGRKLNLYITPDNGTVASDTLIDRVYTVVSQSAPLTTWLNVLPTGVTYMQISMTVTGNKSYTSDVITDQIVQALLDRYSIENTSIGDSVRVSDIYALIDNLSSVDYLNIDNFYTKPWPVTIVGISRLVVNQYSIQYVNNNMTYYVTFDSNNTYTIRAKQGGYTEGGTIGTPLAVVDRVNNNAFTMDFESNAYVQGNRYYFTVSVPNRDYAEPGYNLPLFTDSSQITLKINEVL